MSLSSLDAIAAQAPARAEVADLQRWRDIAEAAVAAGRDSAAAWAAIARPGLAAAWLAAAVQEKLGEPAAAQTILEHMPEPAWGDARSLWLLTRARLALDLEPGQAASLLRQATKAAVSYRALRQADSLWRRWRKRHGDASLRPLRVAFAGSITVELLFPALQPLLLASGFAPEFWTAPFGQYRQVLLSPDPALRAFAPDVIILCTDWRELGPEPSAEAHAAELAAQWAGCRQLYGAAVIQWNYEVPWIDPMGRLGPLTPGSLGYGVRAVNTLLWNAERAVGGAHILDIESMSSLLGKAAWSDPTAWEISRQYPSTQALPLLARHTEALLRAMRGTTSKCVVLDLDNTLWGGVIGEDGLDGIALGGTGTGAAFRNFQTYLRGLRRRGIFLAVCSKNNEADALLPFQQHPEMVLKQDDIAVFMVNWEPKDRNIRQIAKRLNIGLDSLVFVDDNPAERARIRQFVPEVEVVEMPADPMYYAQALQESQRFESLTLTAEDLLRTDSLRANAQREVLEAASASPDTYLAGLAMQARLEPFREVNLGRIVQLINKTNQFNCTTYRTSEDEVRDWMARPEFFSLTLRLSDRFGDFGLTGILYGFLDAPVLRIANWLMSCRILGRGAEQLLLAAAVEAAGKAGMSAVEAVYIPSAKNNMVVGIYPQFGFSRLPDADAGWQSFRLNLAGCDLRPPAWIATE